MKRFLILSAMTWALAVCAVDASPPRLLTEPPDLAANFVKPPNSAKPWVYWFWINGNISKEGITDDLESFEEVGVGGVLWMEVSGPNWAPEGAVVPLSPQWHDAFQWAITECARLGLESAMTVDFGYGCGGPHITPENSMQRLYWSETEVAGGQKVSRLVPKPEVSKELTCLWLRPGIELNPKVREMIDHTDSYRDVVLLAIPLPDSVEARAYWIPGTIIKSRLETRDRAAQRNSKPVAFPAEAATPPDKVVDLTKRMDANGRLEWDAPGGPWLILRIGHASNYPMTRPSPAAAVGLEADRLAKTGKPRVSGRYTFTTGKHFDALQINRAVFLSKDMALYPSGLLGPVTLKWIAQEEETHP